MHSSNKRQRFARAVLGIIAVVLCGSAIVALAVPRFRWRVEIARLKATGALPEISWKELWQLNRHGDPFNLKDLVTTPSPYLVIKNPFGSADGISSGEKIFESNCTRCHGANGGGGNTGPALKQRQMHNGNSDWAIFKTIS